MAALALGDWAAARLSDAVVATSPSRWNDSKTVYTRNFFYESDCGYDPPFAEPSGGWAGLKEAYVKVLDATNTIEVKSLDQLDQVVRPYVGIAPGRIA